LLSSDLDGIGLLDALPVDAELGGVLLIEALDTLARERFLDAWMARLLSSSPRRLWEPTYRRADARLLAEDATRAAPLFDAAETNRLLCVTRSASRPTGVEALNTALHRRHADVLSRDPGRWLAAEPVLVSRNDYERGLFNGDQGLLLWTAAEGEPARLTAVFRKAEGLVAHPLDLVRSCLELGFATTVHKAQGSEHEVVALVLPDADTRLLTREILYTALTRARRAALVVGDLELFARGLRRRIRRSTGIAERLEPI
jgi:exodeoxyribonuclease V alpha subunit